jgi:hypothetical protein
MHCCPATPAGLGSTRSRSRATGCANGTRLAAAANRRAPAADSHRRLRSESSLRSSRTLFRSLLVAC